MPATTARVLACTVAVLALVAGARAGALYDYVMRPDPTFAWVDTGYRLVPNATNPEWTGYLLNVTSQTWLTEAQVSLSVWHHQLMVFVPADLSTSNIGAIYNTDGSNPLPAKPPGLSDPEVNLISQLAVETKTVTSIIWQVPNQPIVFAADPTHQRRSEDAAVAFTWFEFIFHPENPDYIIELPMTKAVVKGMDAVTEFVKQLNGHDVEKFLVSGASKRGWTTWLVGGVLGNQPDSRVVGIAPIVMDMLDFQPNVLHMYKAYGGWTFAFADYYALNITEYLDSDIIKPLIEIIDPLNYKENLTMPKLVIDATGDEFFMPDDDHFWWGKLEGETYRLMVANADHSMATGLGPLYMSLSAFYQSLVLGQPRPVINWTIAPDTGAITAVSNIKADQAVLRWATSRKIDGGRRDFRLFKGDTPHDPCHTFTVPVFGKACFNPVFWIGEDLMETQVSNGWQYMATQDMPEDQEWRGFFIDFYFPVPAAMAGMTYRFTTQVSIIPQTFPFAPCSGTGCLGYLV